MSIGSPLSNNQPCLTINPATFFFLSLGWVHRTFFFRTPLLVASNCTSEGNLLGQSFPWMHPLPIEPTLPRCSVHFLRTTIVLATLQYALRAPNSQVNPLPTEFVTKFLAPR